MTSYNDLQATTIKVSKDSLSYSPGSFFGNYEKRSEADGEFKKMESAMGTPGQVYATELEVHHDPTSEILIYSKGELEKVVSKPTASPYHEELGLRHAKIITRSGSVLAFPTEFPESAIHEFAHHYLGKHGAKSEMDVVKFEVEELIRMGKWNARYKQYTIHSLATHLATMTRGQRVTRKILDRAKKVVERVEKGAMAEEGRPPRLPKEVADLIG
jgi:hypothetical protein